LKARLRLPYEVLCIWHVSMVVVREVEISVLLTLLSLSSFVVLPRYVVQLDSAMVGGLCRDMRAATRASTNLHFQILYVISAILGKSTI
jgi:hypothetical protein